MKQKSTNTLIAEIYRNPKYQGMHVIIMAGKTYPTKTGKEQAKLLDVLIKKHPRQTPTMLYIPRADTLILILS